MPNFLYYFINQNKEGPYSLGSQLNEKQLCKTWQKGQGVVRLGLEAEVSCQTLPYPHSSPVPDFLFALEKMILPPPTPSSFAFAPPTSSAVLFQWKLGPCQPPFRLPQFEKRTRAQKLQRGRSWRSDRVRSNSRPAQSCRTRSRCGSRARARPAALRAWANRPRVPRCLTRAPANQGVQPGCHVTGEAALFPSAARGRKGADSRA